MRAGLIVFITAGLFLAACGIKPGAVEPPPAGPASSAPAEKAKSFPRTYPDVKTDPIPAGPSPF